MTKAELDVWLDEAELVDGIGREFDGSGNCSETYIYEHAGQLYRLSFTNEKADCKFTPGKGLERGVYEPVPVVRRIRTVEEVYYEEVGAL